MGSLRTACPFFENLSLKGNTAVVNDVRISQMLLLFRVCTAATEQFSERTFTKLSILFYENIEFKIVISPTPGIPKTAAVVMLIKLSGTLSPVKLLIKFKKPSPKIPLIGEPKAFKRGFGLFIIR